MRRSVLSGQINASQSSARPLIAAISDRQHTGAMRYLADAAVLECIENKRISC